MNIETIAQKLNLSNSTVSRALRDCKGVNPKTRAKVLRRANELGYHAPKGDNVTHGVALLLPGNSIDEIHELASRYMIAIGHEVAQLGWQLYMVPIPLHEASILERKETWPKGLTGENVDCCIVVDVISAKARKLLASHFKENIAMISRCYLEDGVSGTGISDYDSAMTATQKLLDLGHENIGWIGSLGSEDISRKRFSGVSSKLFGQGLRMQAEIWMDERTPLEMKTVDSIMTASLPDNKEKWPTAWVASNDWLAAKALLWLEKQGLSCPENFSIICFDDTRIAETLAQRKLTSIVCPAIKIAQGAVKLLDYRWKKRITEPTAWIYPVSYREGDTVASVL
ncbi:MAG: LacI family DNA-binding transcriptional regulator [Victivallales bacterium]|nr:LacI family DNA-binding transcriptional regulator [Victivallales bacterium]